MKPADIVVPSGSPRVYEPSVNGHWVFDRQMDPNRLGFIYVIFDKVLKKAYLGKKLYRGHGKLNKGKESNWKRYRSSSGVLRQHWLERPATEFEFICIEEYDTKSGLSWAETWSLCTLKVCTTDSWYNTRIEKISWIVKELVTADHEQRLTEIERRVK